MLGTLPLLILPAVAAALRAVVFADWRDAKSLREEMGELMAEAEAIHVICKEENREPTNEEAARLDQILGCGKRGEDGYKPGLVDGLKDKADRMERIENRKKEFSLSNRGGSPRRSETPGAQAEDETPEGVLDTSRIRVPASVTRPGNLRAFRRAENREANYRQAFAFGHFALALLQGRADSRQKLSDMGFDVRALAGANEGTLADGGYLVPSELSNAIIDIRDEVGVMRKEVDVETMTRDTKDCAKRLSGLPYFWVAEGAAIGTGKKSWGNVPLVAGKVGCIAPFTSEFSEDAIISIGDDLAAELGESMATAEDDLVLIADGTATYNSFTGLIPAAAAGAKKLIGQTTLEAITLDDWNKAIKALPAKFRKGAKWYLNPTVYDVAIEPILYAQGGNTGHDTANGFVRRFKGKPIVDVSTFKEAVDAVSNSVAGAFDGTPIAIYGNLKAACKLGDRRQLRISKSEHVYFETDEIAVKGTQRLGFKVHEEGTAAKPGAYVVIYLGT